MRGNLRYLPPLTTEDRRRCEREASQELRSWRCSLGWSRPVAAAWLGAGASVDSLCDWENAKTKIPAWVLKAIRRVERSDAA